VAVTVTVTVVGPRRSGWWREKVAAQSSAAKGRSRSSGRSLPAARRGGRRMAGLVLRAGWELGPRMERCSLGIFVGFKKMLLCLSLILRRVVSFLSSSARAVIAAALPLLALLVCTLKLFGFAWGCTRVLSSLKEKMRCHVPVAL
jgi:hypothetical protein